MRGQIVWPRVSIRPRVKMKFDWAKYKFCKNWGQSGVFHLKINNFCLEWCLSERSFGLLCFPSKCGLFFVFVLKSTKDAFGCCDFKGGFGNGEDWINEGLSFVKMSFDWMWGESNKKSFDINIMLGQLKNVSALSGIGIIGITFCWATCPKKGLTSGKNCVPNT